MQVSNAIMYLSLVRSGCQTASELSNALGRGSVAYSLSALEDMGLIERGLSDSDRRQRPYHLTDRGRVFLGLFMP